MIRRPRRNRKSPVVRRLVQETQVAAADLIFPLFLIEGENKKVAVDSMPGIYRFSKDLLLKEIEECVELGLQSFALFPALPEEKKDEFASESYNPDNAYLTTIAAIKRAFPDIMLMSDVAMDPYSSDGHDGLVHAGKILNDETLEILGKMALAQAQAGIDVVGPSDMMDGRVGYIREVLDENKFTEVSILSYTAKYASAFYGPFRDALSSAPKHGDKKTYQMDFANQTEAVLEGQLDFDEGADILMVKPALPYLDVIHVLARNFPLPIAAYNVSGEYAMVKAAHTKGWLNEDEVIVEILTAIKRAGASIILSYFAKDFAKLNRR